MKVETLILGPLQTNCYLVFDQDSKKGLIIDPADEGQFIIQRIRELEMEPLAIIATHGHFDHILAATELKLILNVPFIMHKDDLFLLNSVEERTKHWTGLSADPPLPPDGLLKDNDLISAENSGLQIYPSNKTPSFTVISRRQLGTEESSGALDNQSQKFVIHDSKLLFQVIETPGHTPGSICLYYSSGNEDINDPKRSEASSNRNSKKTVYASRRPSNRYSKEENTLFSGDTIFKKGIGRTDFSYGSKKKLDQSIQKLLKLPPRTVIYPGHGESTILAQEKPSIP